MKRKSQVEKVLTIINELMIGGVLAWSPSASLRSIYRRYHDGNLSKAIYDLKQHGYLEQIEIKGEKLLKLTIKGRLKLVKSKYWDKWDGYWRIIAFDIEEEKKSTRNVFRKKLISLGCRPIQKSVWITPYDISAQLEDLIEILDLENNIDYFLSRALTN